MKRRDFLMLAASSVLASQQALAAPLGNPKAVRPEDFGAKGDGLADDTNPIQKAINSGADEIIFSGKYKVTPQSFPGIPGVIGHNSVCLDVKSNQVLKGQGKIILGKSSHGNSGAILANITSQQINDTTISVSIDGGQIGGKNGFSGIVLINAKRCVIGNDISISNMSYNGIRLARSSLSCRIQNVNIKNVGYIGIQAQQPRNIFVCNNTIENTKDNAIDFESNKGYQDGYIHDNTITKCKTGIFLESGGNCSIYNNKISKFYVAGIFLNRINTPANNVRIYKNIIDGIGNKVQKGGIAINNNIRTATISSNTFKNLDYSIWANGKISHITVGENKNINIGKSIIRVGNIKNDLTDSVVSKQEMDKSTTPIIDNDISNYKGLVIK
ncbi:right-handed parallel beta-helix repeat-containing protein [Klebsiella aerogenes]|nr:right-handed parallel beta-helix repeat-containing protein [Klebsiella aerogenes]